jgi:hypothetical protein
VHDEAPAFAPTASQHKCDNVLALMLYISTGKALPQVPLRALQRIVQALLLADGTGDGTGQGRDVAAQVEFESKV